jgi:hypothetical protein
MVHYIMIAAVPSPWFTSLTSWLALQVFLEGPLKCLCICNGLVPSSHIPPRPPLCKPLLAPHPRDRPHSYPNGDVTAPMCCQDAPGGGGTCQQLIGEIQEMSRQAVAEMERSVLSSSKQCVRYLRMKRDWTNISIILDRIFFLSYVAIIVLSITFLFPRRNAL